jgi:hypothetical protein
MIRFPKYRFVTALLVVVFSVFNVGIPVVVAACPMSESGVGALCGSCYSPTGNGQPVYRQHQDRSCCETVLVSEGSGAEFLKAAPALPLVAGVLFVSVIAPFEFSDYSFQSVTVRSVDTSPGQENLPILLSSLHL